MVIIDKKQRKRQTSPAKSNACPFHLSMIQIIITYCSLLFQEKYNNFIESLNFSSLACSKCSFRGQCKRHSFYTRKIITEHGKEDIRILRVKCSHCKATHALLHKWIVPYSQHLITDQIEIIRANERGIAPHRIIPSNPEIDIWGITYIIKQFRHHWKERLLAIKTSVFDGTDQLISICFDSYNRQFMQIKRTRNALFLQTT